MLSLTACLLMTHGRLSADEVTSWNEIATRASFQSGLGIASGNPLFESRVYAMMHAAIHDALNSIERRYEPYALNMQVNPAASPQAAVSTAAHDVLVDQFNQLGSYGVTSQQTFLDAMYAASLAAIPNGAAKELRNHALAELRPWPYSNLRANDGWNAQPPMNTSYPQGTAPGEYRFTPGTPFAFSHILGNCTALRPG